MTRTRIEPQLLRRLSVRRVLDVIRDRGPCSRAELSRHCGISAPTVSKVVAGLLQARLVEEGAPDPASTGRPGRRVRMATEGASVLALSLDARRCALIAASLDGRLIESSGDEVPVPSQYEVLLDVLEATLRPRLEDPHGEVLGVGISVPGLLDQDQQRILLSPNLPITNQQRPAHDLQQRLGVPCAILQESHALCLTEGRIGAARGLEHYAVMDVSTGLGLGVVEGGALLRGRRGLAGELGHWTVDSRGRLCGCGNVGCLETVATDTALFARLEEILGPGVDLTQLPALAERPEVRRELDRSLEALAVAVAAVVNLFNPEAVFVFGRQFSLLPGRFEQLRTRALQRSLAPSREDCRIEPARGGKLEGAVAGILDAVLDRAG